MTEFSVRQARALSGKTQKNIAELMKIHRQTYASLERHPEKFTIQQANEFATIVNIPYDQIKFFSPRTQL